MLLVFTAISTGLVLALRWWDPPSSAFMLRAAWQGKPVQYQWRDWEGISPNLAIAIIAAEDQRFPDHSGFDIAEIRNAVGDSIKGDRLRGASTLTQQVAKNLFLWRQRGVLRKGLEAWFTLWIELFWDKQRILEVYVNIAQFGPDVYGAEAASIRYFGRPARQAGARQAALMAAVLPNPYRLSLQNPSAYVLDRAARIQSQVRSLGGPGYLSRLAD